VAAERVRRFLDQAGVEYEADVHPRAVDAQRLAREEHVSGWMVAKPVMLVTEDDELVMFVIPGPARVDLERAAEVVRQPVRLAREDEFSAVFPDCEPGAEPPFGNLYGVDVHVDPILGNDSELVFRAGTHDTAIRIRTQDYLEVIHQVDAPVAILPELEPR